MIRAIVLSLVLMLGLGALIPLSTDYAEAGSRKNRKKKYKKYKKYSKAWWRQYHARQKRKKSLASRRRALRLRQIRLAKARVAQDGDQNKAVAMQKPAEQKPAILPSGAPAPKGWVNDQSTSSELQFRVDDGNGSQIGSAAISVVGTASGETIDQGRNRAVGGVPTTSLRREVINRMIRENGWVVNDYQKEIGGQKVYVVVAQSQATGGRVQSRMFYFTEVEGRIYSVATNAPNDNAERLAEESEKVINSLQSRVRPNQQAAVKE